MMLPDQYQAQAMRTASPATRSSSEAMLATAALGLAGEAGEFADHIKKVMFHGHPLDEDLLQKELGDILWYVALACTAINLGMEEVMSENIQKLRERYPEGFSSTRSMHRA